MKSQGTGHEELIKELARRIKKIEESSSPMVGGAAKHLYIMNKERLEAEVLACQQGKPLGEAGNLGRLLKAMGFTFTRDGVSAEYAPASFGEHQAIVERMGFPGDKLCDKIVTQLANRETSALPKPDVIYADSHGCDIHHNYYARMQADLFNIPVFFVDVGLNEDNKPNLANLNYIADQLGEFIEWAEKKVPGIKYDEAKHIQLLEMDAIGQKYVREIYQLVKHIPCPFAPSDVLSRFYGQCEPSRYPNMQKALDYLRNFRDEVAERVASGQGPYPEERLRLIWAGQSSSFQSVDPSKVLLERKVALPLSIVGRTLYYVGLRGVPYGEVSEYGVILSPLQEEARWMDRSCWGGPGKRWVNDILHAARDVGAHGIIHFNLIACTPMRGMGSVVAERAEKEQGIPVLNIEARYLDRDYMSQEKFDEILSTFIDKCFDWAGKPRQ